MRYMMFICLLLPLLLKSQDATPVFVSGQEGHKVYRIPAVIGSDQITGCQFHPEKSGEVGLKILRRFCVS